MSDRLQRRLCAIADDLEQQAFDVEGLQHEAGRFAYSAVERLRAVRGALCEAAISLRMAGLDIERGAK